MKREATRRELASGSTFASPPGTTDQVSFVLDLDLAARRWHGGAAVTSEISVTCTLEADCRASRGDRREIERKTITHPGRSGTGRSGTSGWVQLTIIHSAEKVKGLKETVADLTKTVKNLQKTVKDLVEIIKNTALAVDITDKALASHDAVSDFQDADWIAKEKEEQEEKEERERKQEKEKKRKYDEEHDNGRFDDAPVVPVKKHRK